MIIAIDGPAGSGKSTVAQIIASRLNFKYIETGSMYRAVAWKALQKGIDPEDQNRIAEVARTISIEFLPGAERQKVMVDGEDLTPVLKTETIGRLAAVVAANKAVREVLVAQQQKMGRNGNVVMDGRDIGTVVFPEADKKFFLVADQKERAQRRHQEIQAKSQAFLDTHGNAYALTIVKSDKKTGIFNIDTRYKGQVTGLELTFNYSYDTGRLSLVDETAMKGPIRIYKGGTGYGSFIATAKIR